MWKGRWGSEQEQQSRQKGMLPTRIHHSSQGPGRAWYTAMAQIHERRNPFMAVHIKCRMDQENSQSAFSQRVEFQGLVQMQFFWICPLTCLYFLSQKISVVKRKPKRTPTSPCWTRSCLCTGGTVMRKCMPAATSTQGEESISSSLTTPTPCGGQSQSTTESITLDKDVTESGVQGWAEDGILLGNFF